MRLKYFYLLGGLIVLGYLLTNAPDWRNAVSTAIVTVVKPILVPVVDLINDPAFVYTISFLIICSAVAACIAFHRRSFRPRMNTLVSASWALQNLPRPRERTEHEVGVAIQQLGDLLRQHNLFPSAWAGFQVQFSSSRGIPDAPFSTFTAQDPSLDEFERRGLMQSLPNYLTSVGLIFTFVGLVVALYFAAKGFDTGDINNARTAILQLLNASSFKFMTSVAALVAAMIVSLYLRFCASTIRSETDLVISLIEGYLSLWRGIQSTREKDGRQLTPAVEAINLCAERIANLVSRVENLIEVLENGRGTRRDAAE